MWSLIVFFYPPVHISKPSEHRSLAFQAVFGAFFVLSYKSSYFFWADTLITSSFASQMIWVLAGRFPLQNNFLVKFKNS